ncbi:hypothetical protein G5I_11309 [Acromyrmex echinatior]|uniref:Uncharacterized protein n=1 Tax=Acromyrmex echinatior TaxID=103372 RepID=F4WZ94_ACREC|nr:hypothetical protein G5I_11309 [Acromyrmex echinatior]
MEKGTPRAPPRNQLIKLGIGEECVTAKFYPPINEKLWSMRERTALKLHRFRIAALRLRITNFKVNVCSALALRESSDYTGTKSKVIYGGKEEIFEASRYIFGAGIVGRQIDLSLDLVDGIRSSEREQPTGGSSVCTTFSHHAEQHILTTSTTRDCELPRIGSPRIPATRDSSRRRAGNYVFLLDKMIVERFSNQSRILSKSLNLCIEYRSEKQFCQWKVSYGQKTAFHGLQKLLCEMEKVCQIRIKRIVCWFVWAKLFWANCEHKSMLHNNNVCNWSESQLVNTIARCAKRSQLLYLVASYQWNSVSSPTTEYSCRIRATAYNAQDNYTGMSVVRIDDGARFDIVLFTKLCHVYCLYALTRLTLHLRLAHLIGKAHIYRTPIYFRNSPTCSNLMQYIRSRLEFSEPFPQLYCLSDCGLCASIGATIRMKRGATARDGSNVTSWSALTSFALQIPRCYISLLIKLATFRAQHTKHFIFLFTFLVDKLFQDKQRKSYINYILPISRSTSEQPQHRYNLHKTLWPYEVSVNFEIYSYRFYDMWTLPEFHLRIRKIFNSEY